MIGIIGKKIGMTKMCNEESKSIPCTILQGGKYTITQIKTIEKDGYNSVQFGFEGKKEKHMTKQIIGHISKANIKSVKQLFECRDFKINKDIKVGDTFSIKDFFEEGEFVDAVGQSKGKGFQGVVKRHGFSGVGDRTHGQHNRQRAPGSIGGASFPSRVFKGIKMAGRTGGKKIKIQNLEILKIIPEKNIVVINGSVPGAKNSYIMLQK